MRAIESKFSISAYNIRNVFRKSKLGVVAKVDDDMLKYYCNEDIFIMQVVSEKKNDEYFVLD